MSRSSAPPRRLRASHGAAAGRELGSPQVEALTVAMIVAPGVYARNRMFDLFVSPGARRARMRASIVRGIVPQLARASAISLSDVPGVASSDAVYVLRYAIPTLRLSRVVELSAAELAALRLVAARAGVQALPIAPGDRHVVATVLARLMDGGGAEVARLVDGFSE